MQFQVPQNIAMEDKIVGPFSAIQFTILVFGWGFSFFIATSFGIPSPLNDIAGVVLAVIVFLMAAGKFNDQPMYKFIKYIFSYIFTPKVRIWHKKGGKDFVLIREESEKKEEAKQEVSKKVSKKDIARLAVLLDSRGKVGAKPQTPSEKRPAKNKEG